MKPLLFILTLCLLAACVEKTSDTKQLQARIDSLEKDIATTYKPGLGEFMSGIQVHHAKLWFAGLHENWPLAEFEIHEITEAVEDIQKFCMDRPEVKSVEMIRPAIDSVSRAITQKSPVLFRNSFTLLTTTCNNCHQATEHAFNVVTIPSAEPVSNQDFKPFN